MDWSPLPSAWNLASTFRLLTTSLMLSFFEKCLAMIASMTAGSPTTASTLPPSSSRRSSTARKLLGDFIAIFSRLLVGLYSIGMTSYIRTFSDGITSLALSSSSKPFKLS